MSKQVFAIALLLSVVGCTAMTELAGVGVIEERTASFDNATVITLSPAFLYSETASKWTGFPYKLGARWTSSSPDSVAIVLAHSSNTSGSSSNIYTNFTGLGVNIDGKIVSYKTSGFTRHDSSAYNSISKTIYTESRNSVIVPLVVLKAMVAAKDCRLRFHSTDGYLDATLSAEKFPGGHPTAIVPLRKFLGRIDADDTQIQLPVQSGGSPKDDASTKNPTPKKKRGFYTDNSWDPPD